MSRRSRRQFLEDSMFAAAVAITGSASVSKGYASAGSRTSPLDRLGVAVVGVRGRGNTHLAAFSASRDTEVLFVCDPDASVGRKRAEETARRQGRSQIPFVRDFRDAIHDSRIDIVSIATPAHWQAWAAVYAMRAGKDVYLEKPGSLSLQEGRWVAEAARRYGRICQIGLQHRSSVALQHAMRYLHSGRLGKLQQVRGYSSRVGVTSPRGESSPPADLDYALWLGPAPWAPIKRRRFHYDWRWQWDYGGGELTDRGLPQLDLARWGVGLVGHSQRSLSLGGRFGPEDAGETPNTLSVLHELGETPFVLEIRANPYVRKRKHKVGVLFESSEGYLVAANLSSAVAFDRSGRTLRTFTGGGDHFGNFVEAVRRRAPEMLAADAHVGRYSSALAHLGNLSYRLGRQAAWETLGRELSRFELSRIAVPAGQRLWEEVRRWDEPPSHCVVGAELAFHGDSESFESVCPGDLQDLQSLLGQTYRDPYDSLPNS